MIHSFRASPKARGAGPYCFLGRHKFYYVAARGDYFSAGFIAGSAERYKYIGKIGTLLYYQVCYEENNLIQLAAFARVHYVFPLEHPPPPSGDSMVFSPGTALSTCCGSIDIS